MIRRDSRPTQIWRRGRAMALAALMFAACAGGASIQSIPSMRSLRPMQLMRPIRFFAAQAVLSPYELSLRTVRIGVFSLFRPKELVVRPVSEPNSGLTLELGGSSMTLPESAAAVMVHESSGDVLAQLGGQLQSMRPMRGASLRILGPNPHAVDSAHFWLEVPGKLRRQFTGTLEIRVRGQSLEAIVSMPLETAVASVVQAESPPGADIEALKAQAVAARSFLVARLASHADFDFCDTTHCQFLRSPPGAQSAVARATQATAGLVLAWHDATSAQDRTLAAMYARSCGGHSRTLKEIGMKSAGYPYYAVRCSYCSRHPEIWRREAQPGVGPGTEQDRLNFNRIHGWGAIPSIGASAHESSTGEEGKWMTGRGVGHGIGLCQLGAADMARHGASFAEILSHYYPNTRLVSVPGA
jgi:hypothetical protein